MSEQLEFLYGHRLLFETTRPDLLQSYSCFQTPTELWVELPTIDGRNYSTSWIGKTL